MRITRETVTISLTYLIKSDTDDNKPVPSPPHDEEGDQPTRVYPGSYPMGTEDLSKIRAGMLKRLEAVFPVSGSDGIHLEFEDAETTNVE